MKELDLTGMSCPLPEKNSTSPKVVSRIYIGEDGNLVVTDLWTEVKELLFTGDGSFNAPSEDL